MADPGGMSDVRFSFPVLDTAAEGTTSLDARSFRRAALALATGRLPKHTLQQPVYIVAPQPRSRLVPVLLAAISAVAVAAVLVWLL